MDANDDCNMDTECVLPRYTRVQVSPAREFSRADEHGDATGWDRRWVSGEVERVVPRAAAGNGAPGSGDIQRCCGRWLTWRRVHIRVTSQFMAAWLGIPHKTLLLIEAGHGDATMISRLVCGQLSFILADVKHPPASIATIIASALGQIGSLNEGTLEQITSDLRNEPLRVIY